MTAPVATTLPCQVHGGHRPESHVNDVHHVWPLGDGGPNHAANRIVVCPTGHYNIHRLLDLYRAGGVPPWSVRRTYGFWERRFAALGWERIQRQAM